jgi:CUE domain
MSETQARPSAQRGRGSSRGGRGSRSGPRGGSRNTTNGDFHQKVENVPTTSYEDEGELGELKRKYSAKLNTIKELFPDWTDEDIVFALHETNGDLEGTINRITEGMLPRFYQFSRIGQ